MYNLDIPLAAKNPEAARHLALSGHYLHAGDFDRALHYARLTLAEGEPLAAVRMLSTLVNTQRFDAAAEMAALFLTGRRVHHTVRQAVLEAIVPALYYLGAKTGDCTEAFGIAYELAAHGRLAYDLPRWEGQPLHNKRLLLTLPVTMFGGNGDHIMWARFVPFLATRGADIVVQGARQLATLFSTIPGVVSTCTYEERPTCDYAIGLDEVPHALGMRGVPVENPFHVGALPLPEDKYNVGINWGASWVATNYDRTCLLTEYAPIANIPSVQLFAVQKGPHQRQLYPAPAGLDVLDLGPRLHDFRDTAIALMSLDAVVTTDNAVANLACMLGRPTFVLVPRYADWRWGEGGRTPWYPTARVYQQDVVGDWDGPIARLTNDLSAYLADHAKPLKRPASQPVAPEGTQ